MEPSKTKEETIPLECLSPATRVVYDLVQRFYQVEYRELIPPSHGWRHVCAVFCHAYHACQELECADRQHTEVQIAALLHDADDHKYFPPQSIREEMNSRTKLEMLASAYPNAYDIMMHKANEQLRNQSNAIGDDSNLNSDENRLSSSSFVLTDDVVTSILEMISWVSCSQNGNTVPPTVKETEHFYKLIPRWADRLEAIGAIGVVRCYQYTTERNRPLHRPGVSPCPRTVDELWSQHATPDRFELYQSGTKKSAEDDDMISHYYDKLLHIARPPPDIVRNEYLERMALQSCEPLLHVCLSYGKTGQVDVQYIEQLKEQLGIV